MSHQHPSSRELHDRHADERVRVAQITKHETTVRQRERERILAHLGAPVDNEDITGFCPGGKV